jgi:hypothetical protein
MSLKYPVRWKDHGFGDLGVSQTRVQIPALSLSLCAMSLVILILQIAVRMK